MSLTDRSREGDVRALIADEPPLVDDPPHAFGGLHRLCRAAARSLPAMGVGVMVMSDRGDPTLVASSGAKCDEIQELQLTLGEGPCLDAHAWGRPVLTADLAEVSPSRWPGYGPAAQDRGVRSVFSFPLQMGAARLGAMDVYRDRTGALTRDSLHRSLAFAGVAMDLLLGDHPPGGGESPALLDGAHVSPFALYQAQGMLMIQLGVGLEEAMSRLRAHAYAHDRRVSDVADDIVTRRLTLEPDVS